MFTPFAAEGCWSRAGGTLRGMGLIYKPIGIVLGIVGGLLGVEVLGLLAVLGAAEVEVAGHAQQLVGRDGGARPAPAVGDVGLDRPQVAPAVEDHRQLLADREAADAQGDRCRRLRVDQRSAEQVLGVVLVQCHLRVNEDRPWV